MLLALLGEYRSSMRRFAALPNLAVWYSHIDVEGAIKELQAGVGAAARSGRRPTWPRRGPATACTPSTS